MAKAKAYKEEEVPIQRLRPALTPEAREAQMISLAEDLAEKQLLEGTASSQVIVHYLKLGSMKERHEIEKLKADTMLQQAKVEALGSAQRVEAMYEEAMRAFRRYSGYGEYDEDVE
jgi:hypothetical protein